MFTTALSSALFKIVLALCAIAIGRLALGFFDRYWASERFTQWLWSECDDYSRAHYLGLRFLGICIAIGLVLG